MSFYLLYDPKTTFKSRLEIAWNYALMLPYNYMRNHYGHHYTISVTKICKPLVVHVVMSLP